MSYEEAVRRINAFKKDKKAIDLDLSGLGLVEIPKEIQQLNSCANLKKLNLENNQIQDVSRLANLKSLELLGLSNNQIADITVLKELKNLTKLALGNNQVIDIQALEKLEKLMGLGLNNNKITDISVLSKLKELILLGLTNNQIVDIQPLGKLKNLTELYLANNQIVDIGVFGKLESGQLEKLTVLGLANNQIVDIGVFGKLESGQLEKLTGLGLNNNQIKNVEALGKLKNLTDLGLANNQLTSIAALGELENLTKLYLNDNQIKDIAALGKLEHLVVLGLINNQIGDISVLGKLKKLTELGLANNQIQDTTNLKNLDKLQALDISNNQISDKRAWKTFFAKGQKGKNALFFGELSENIEKWLDEKAPKGIESLQKLPLLNELWLNGNKISEVDFSEMPNLKKVYLGNNPIESIKTGNKAIEINFENELESDERLSFVPQLMQLNIGMDKKVDNLQIGTETTHKKIDNVQTITENVQSSIDALHTKVNALLVELPKLRQEFKDNLNGLCDKIKKAVGWNDIADTNYAEQLQKEWQGRDSSKLFDVLNCSGDLRCALFLFDVIPQKEQNYTPCIALFCRALEAEFKGFFMDFISNSFNAGSYIPTSGKFYKFLTNPTLNHTTLGDMKTAFIEPDPNHKQARDYAINNKFDATKFAALVTKIGNDVGTNNTTNKILYFRNGCAHPGQTFSKVDAEACKNLVFDLLRDWIDARR